MARVHQCSFRKMVMVPRAMDGAHTTLLLLTWHIEMNNIPFRMVFEVVGNFACDKMRFFFPLATLYVLPCKCKMYNVAVPSFYVRRNRL